MSRVVFIDPIDHISGKIARKFRTVYCYRRSSDLRYTTVRGERTTQPSSAELDARERFAAVAHMVKVRRKDLTKIDDDQAAFLAQRNTPGGRKTMTQYLWQVCGQEYDQAHNG